MEQVSVKNCGKSDRKIYINKEQPKKIHIGCFIGTKQEAIERITREYTIDARRDDYIAKVEECFRKVPFWWHFPLRVQFTEEFKKQVQIIIQAVMFLNILVTAFLAFLSLPTNEVLDPLNVYIRLTERSLFFSSCYVVAWVITIIGVIKWITAGVRLSIK